MQRMILEKSEPFLPEWNDWDKMLKLGLKLFGAGFIYSLPAMAIMVIGYLGMLVPAILTSSSSAYSNSAMGRFLGLQLFGMFGGMACFGFGVFFALALLAVLPV